MEHVGADIRLSIPLPHWIRNHVFRDCGFPPQKIPQGKLWQPLLERGLTLFYHSGTICHTLIRNAVALASGTPRPTLVEPTALGHHPSGTKDLPIYWPASTPVRVHITVDAHRSPR